MTTRRAPEKVEERLADQAAALLGFASVHFSQSRATQQTRGIPDRKYYHERLGVTFWFEGKAENGTLSNHQRAFHAMARACGETVIVGTAEAAVEHMESLILPTQRN